MLGTLNENTILYIIQNYVQVFLLDESWESPLKLACGTGGVIYGNSGLAASTPATAEAAGISRPPLLWADDLREFEGWWVVSAPASDLHNNWIEYLYCFQKIIKPADVEIVLLLLSFVE